MEQVEKSDFDVSEINTTCGDRIRLTGKIENNKLVAVQFTAEGCAISKASASLFTEKIKNQTLSKLRQIKDEDVLKTLPVSITPARHNCALLCFRALRKRAKISSSDFVRKLTALYSELN